jgi:hypothetical protein
MNIWTSTLIQTFIALQANHFWFSIQSLGTASHTFWIYSHKLYIYTCKSWFQRGIKNLLSFRQVLLKYISTNIIMEGANSKFIMSIIVKRAFMLSAVKLKSAQLNNDSLMARKWLYPAASFPSSFFNNFLSRSGGTIYSFFHYLPRRAQGTMRWESDIFCATPARGQYLHSRSAISTQRKQFTRRIRRTMSGGWAKLKLPAHRADQRWILIHVSVADDLVPVMPIIVHYQVHKVLNASSVFT